MSELPLSPPPLAQLEQLPDPKNVLYELLREASGGQVRRRRKFPAARHARRVAECIDDFAPLRTLSAFQALESDIGKTIKAQGWDSETEIPQSHQRVKHGRVVRNLTQPVGRKGATR